MQSHTAEGNDSGWSDPSTRGDPAVPKLIGSCPTVTASLGGVELKCLLDTESIVTTMSYSFFAKHFQGNLNSCHWLRIKAANWLDIPYVGYLEVDIEVLGKVVPNRGILVVKDPPGQLPQPNVPGILGMNVIRECYNELFRQHGPSLFDLPFFTEGASPGIMLSSIVTMCRLRQAPLKQVRIRGWRPVCIPAGTVKIVPITCPQGRFGPFEYGLFEPAGVLISPAVVTMQRGTAYIPVVNVSITDAMLHPRTTVGTLSPAHIVSLPEGVTEVASFPQGQVSAVSSQVSAGHTQQDPIDALNLSNLPLTQQDKVRGLLKQYS